MRIVAALGGNALLKRGELHSDANQRANVRRAAVALAPLCAGGNEVIITHGNGPQVGLLALQSAAGPVSGQHSLDVLNAESEGMLGYLIEQELRNVLPPDKLIASILTQVVVDPNDTAFESPSKPIGPQYSKDDAQRLVSERGWSITKDGAGWRRSVASPSPLAIVELSEVALLVSQGVVVICVGGGGIPVARSHDGSLHGVEAVIDKDRASALLGCEICADCLLLLTDVDGVYLDWCTSEQRAIAIASPQSLEPSQFEPGSMGPKVEAAIAFACQTGKPATIGRLEDAAAMLGNFAGTTIDTSQIELVMRN